MNTPPHLIPRTSYLDRLQRLRQTHFIKVIMGPRRSGKSTLLHLHREALRREGVPENHIISFNLDDIADEQAKSAEGLYQSIICRIVDDETHYVYIDEVQECVGFEHVLNSLLLKPNLDVYVTGSNAYLLSGELATYLTGRYMPLEVMPYSFAEFRLAVESDQYTKEEDFNRYVNIGSFPAAAVLRDNGALLNDYYEMLVTGVLFRDIQSRLELRDANLLRKLVNTLASFIGSAVSARNITNTLVSAGHTVSNKTISAYLTGIEASYIFLKVPRYDVVGRKILTTQEKYYLCDPGLHRRLAHASDPAYGRLLENIVFLELRRRYTSVFIGKAGQNEVDFVALRGDDVHYYQVSTSVLDPEVYKREVGAFSGIRDNHERFLLTLDTLGAGRNINGIKQLNVLDWLLDPSETKA